VAPTVTPAAPAIATVPAAPSAPGAPPARVAAAPGMATAAPPQPAGIAPIANFTRSNQGWTASLQMPEAAVSIAYRIGETGDFEETGELQAIDPRTGKPMPNPSFSLPNEQQAVTVYVRYVDPWGRTMGPFPIAFNPLGALVDGQKRILEQMWTSWLSFRNDRGFDNLLYFTHLVSYRCAIKQAVIDVEGGPSTILPMPPCDEKNPYAIPSNFTPYIKIPVTSKKATLQITYTDGTKSRVRTFTR
jgi:hypothetical protein